MTPKQISEAEAQLKDLEVQLAAAQRAPELHNSISNLRGTLSVTEDSTTRQRKELATLKCELDWFKRQTTKADDLGDRLKFSLDRLRAATSDGESLRLLVRFSRTMRAAAWLRATTSEKIRQREGSVAAKAAAVKRSEAAAAKIRSELNPILEAMRSVRETISDEFARGVRSFTGKKASAQETDSREPEAGGEIALGRLSTPGAMTLKLSSNYCSPRGVAQKGELIEVGADEARQLIAAGAAEAISAEVAA